MHTYVMFQNENKAKDKCSGEIYKQFLDYAFCRADYFMLVYVDENGKGFSSIMQTFENDLKPFEVKRRSNPSWPGTISTFTPNTTYQIVFYKTTEETKTILQRVDSLSTWSCPDYPQDLAFFIGNKCWSFSVGHEMMAGLLSPSNEDLLFLERVGLASRADFKTDRLQSFDIYDEMIVEGQSCPCYSLQKSEQKASYRMIDCDELQIVQCYVFDCSPLHITHMLQSFKTKYIAIKVTKPNLPAHNVLQAIFDTEIGKTFLKSYDTPTLVETTMKTCLSCVEMLLRNHFDDDITFFGVNNIDMLSVEGFFEDENALLSKGIVPITSTLICKSKMLTITYNATQYTEKDFSHLL